MFTFTANEAATFECSLTAPTEPASWTACTYPRSIQYADLAVGDYLFRVRAVGSGGVDPTPASRQFNIGVAHMAKKDEKAAEEAWKKAIEMKPDAVFKARSAVTPTVVPV